MVATSMIRWASFHVAFTQTHLVSYLACCVKADGRALGMPALPIVLLSVARTWRLFERLQGVVFSGLGLWGVMGGLETEMVAAA